jgi:hypothetical protein
LVVRKREKIERGIIIDLGKEFFSLFRRRRRLRMGIELFNELFLDKKYFFYGFFRIWEIIGSEIERNRKIRINSE